MLNKVKLTDEEFKRLRSALPPTAEIKQINPSLSNLPTGAHLSTGQALISLKKKPRLNLTFPDDDDIMEIEPPRPRITIDLASINAFGTHYSIGHWSKNITFDPYRGLP